MKFGYIGDYKLFERVEIAVAEEILSEYNDFFIYNQSQVADIHRRANENQIATDDDGEIEPIAEFELTDPNVPQVGRDPDVILEDPGVPLIAGQIPLYSPNGGQASWALLNLILSIIGVLSGAIITVHYIVKKRRDDKEKQARVEGQDRFAAENDTNSYDMASMLEDEEAEEEESGKRKRFTALLIAGVVAVLAVILFILTQDMRLPMVLVDFWTIAHVILLIGEIIALRAVYKKKDQEDEDDDDGLEALLADAEA